MKGALKGGKQVLMGNHAVAVGAALSRAQVVAAYPITPQTQVVELLAEMHAEGSFTGRFMRVESEHSAMAALIGASTAGARTFTASSSQGLAYMHEMLHWAAGARLPIVMANVNRALGAPWILWTDQTDSLSQRDTGWMQVYCASNQEVLDSVIMSYKVSERLMVPTMVVLDGFILSHTYEPIDVPEAEAVDRFLPPLKPRDPLMTSRPRTYGSLPTPKDFFRLRRRLAADMDSALGVIEEVGAEFGKVFGRSYGLFEAYRCEDAEAVLVTSGSAAQTALEAVDELRKQGRKAGNLRMRVFRPFPAEALRRFVKPEVPLIVVDRNFSQGQQGIFCEELQAALFPLKRRPPVYGFVAGLGGGDITVELLKETWLDAVAGKVKPGEPAWVEDSR